MQSFYCSLSQLPGLDRKELALLESRGIQTTQQLLALTRSLEAKQILAIELQLPLKYIHKWSALADLARVPAVGDRYCGLLLHSGIASVNQLAQVSVAKLHPTIKRLYVNTTRSTDLIPQPSLVQKWIEEARVLS